MRPKATPLQKATVRGVSLPVELQDYIALRANQCDLSYSGYLRCLIEHDRKVRLLTPAGRAKCAQGRPMCRINT